ncbi:alpha/beta hydrolase family protein [Haloimpatiens sp. FM7330]|uniref:alpha/beta hydrolase family protein n=1 Tax=Haloimpatiens sp. FM7330 TaxID=3298610 RepID=UPI0036257222
MEKIKIDDITKFKFLSGVKYSPNKNNACFVVAEADKDENKYISNLWIYDVKENKYFQLTTLGKENSFIWLNDSENILFPTIRSEKEKKRQETGEDFTSFYKININGGEAKKYFEIPMKVKNIKELDQNTFLICANYNINKGELFILSDEEKEEKLKKIKEDKDYEVIDEIPFCTNGQGYTNKNRNRLYLYHKDKNELEALTGEYMDINYFTLNEDKTQIVFIAQEFKSKMKIQDSVFIMDINSKTINNITTNKEFSYSYADFIDENKIICTCSNMKKYGLNENQKFYIIDIESKKQKCITPDFDISIWNSVCSDCRYGGSTSIKKYGEYVYFITTEVESSYLNRIDKNGNIQKIIISKGSVDSYDVSDDEILFIGLRGSKLQEIYKLEHDKKEKQITGFNEWVQKDRDIASIERVAVETDTDVKIDGWIMKPINFNENEKYPAILDIHGGPKTVYGEVFFHEMQYWAGKGYVVFFCNPRGSNGKGSEFADIRGKYGNIDYEDIMKFTDYVLERFKFIDKERIGVTGGSYGGFMTNWIIGHTNRFKAAVSQRSISNWFTEFGVADIGYYFANDQNNGATPWDNPEILWEHSPLKYADKVSTPTLFIHSQEDYRCPLEQGIQMFTALKYHNIDARLCMFKGENHELSRGGKPKHRIRRLKEITEWFDKYLKC